MEPSAWQRLSPLLDELFDADPQERAERIARLKAEEPQNVGAIVDLLAKHEELERRGFLRGVACRFDEAETLAGQRVGSYCLERLLGEGGMGAVWLAQRSDGLYEGKVAIKFLHLALLEREGTKRFASEGRVLAKLNHPNVARLIDAGLSETGQPYLVLEYVDGEPIDRFCDRRRLNVAARLRLFLDVLTAVEHAHGRLILHRDLKPSNILVARDGHVKLLDFGIAKLLQNGTDASRTSELTQQIGRACTPDYASPELLEGGELTMSSDVYSLGRLLFVMLVGKLPPRENAFRDGRRTAPPFMSQCAAQIDRDQADARATSPLQLSQMLRGDLDNVVAKALKADATERYAAVSALGDDVRRYLEHRPVSARPASPLYRVQKFLTRNPVLVVTIAFALLASVLGVVGVSVAARQALQSAALAEQERRRADEEARAARTALRITAAQNAFDRAVLRRQTGLHAEACGDLKYSMQLEPALGTELYLAECLQATGALAEAWLLYRRSAATARARRQQSRFEIALTRAQCLEPKLSRLERDIATSLGSRFPSLSDTDFDLGEAAWRDPLTDLPRTCPQPRPLGGIPDRF